MFVLLIVLGSSRLMATTHDLPLQCEAPQWLQNSVRGSMNAVWRELKSSRLSHGAAVEALALVGSRLFPGFHVALSPRNVVHMSPEEKWTWNVSITFPDFGTRPPSPCVDWLNGDIEKTLPELRELVEGVPPESLRWSSDSFQNALHTAIGRYLPGWHSSARVQAENGHADLEVKIYPEPPLLLAVIPETLSRTVPQILADKVNDKTLEFLSPLTGLPLDWLSQHRAEIVSWLSEKQLENGWLQALHASAKNEISLKPLARVSTQLESTTFSLRGWLSAHAGSEARLEAGFHFGRYFTMMDGIPSEVYAEMIIGLKHWHTDGRLGFRFSPLSLVWLGVEGSTEDDSSLWSRIWLGNTNRGLYAWLRYGNENELEAAIGYRLNRFISLEMYYDDRLDDRLSLRALSNI